MSLFAVKELINEKAELLKEADALAATLEQIVTETYYSNNTRDELVCDWASKARTKYIDFKKGDTK